VLEVRDVTLTFSGVRALENVTFGVEDGDCFGLVGPNGAGKTALLNCISGAYHPQAGSILFDGKTITGRPAERIAQMGLGRTFQSMDHFEGFTVQDYVLLGRIAHLSPSTVLAALRWPSVVRREKAERRNVDAVLERCGLTEYRDIVLSEVPYGTQKLVDVARVICSGARWVLLDEPTSGTTSAERPAISAAVDTLRELGTTVVLVDHDVDFVARQALHLIALDQGQLIAAGTTRAVLDHPLVRRIYFGLVREDQVDALEHSSGGQK
jgi:branched-chain amino acid transport system ATP-binding protein